MVDVTQLEKLWHKGPDYTKDGAAIPLIFRVATVRWLIPPAAATAPAVCSWQQCTAVLSSM